MKHMGTALIFTILLAATKIPLPAVPGLPAANASADTASHLVVYYFHGTSRCRTCRTIEKYTRSAVQSAFGDELASGSMELRAVNIDLDENRHFIQDYQLFTRSVVISLLRGDKQVDWKRLDRVWELVRDESAFSAYIRGEIRALMGEKRQ